MASICHPLPRLPSILTRISSTLPASSQDCPICNQCVTFARVSMNVCFFTHKSLNFSVRIDFSHFSTFISPLICPTQIYIKMISFDSSTEKKHKNANNPSLLLPFILIDLTLTHLDTQSSFSHIIIQAMDVHLWQRKTLKSLRNPDSTISYLLKIKPLIRKMTAKLCFNQS